MLDPLHEPARIRAFFVHPDWARCGIGGVIPDACEEAIRAAGFRAGELVATLPGEPFYPAFGYVVAERYDIPLVNGLRLPVVQMKKTLS